MKVMAHKGRLRATVECDCATGWRYSDAGASRCDNPAHRTASLINAARMPARLRDAVLPHAKGFGSVMATPSRRAACESTAGLLSGKTAAMLLVGDADVGKSHIAAYIAMQVIAAGHGVVWCMAEDIDQAARRGYDNKQGPAQSLSRFIEAPLLVIDELKAATPHASAMLGRVIRGRYEWAAGETHPTIITGNGSIDAVSAVLEGHIWSRLKSVARVFELVEAGWRGEVAA